MINLDISKTNILKKQQYQFQGIQNEPDGSMQGFPAHDTKNVIEWYHPILRTFKAEMPATGSNEQDFNWVAYDTFGEYPSGVVTTIYAGMGWNGDGVVTDGYMGFQAIDSFEDEQLGSIVLLNHGTGWYKTAQIT